MKDLLVSNSGDLIISRNDLQLVSKGNLTAQKARLNLATNKGEWALNPDVGIDFRAILVKNPNKDEIIDAIRDGLRQIDESFRITEYDFVTEGRHMTVKFKAVNDSGEEVSLEVGNVSGNGSGNDDNWLIRALADLVEVQE